MKSNIDVIIPTYKPDQTFEKLISRLQKQTVKPDRIIVVNTSSELWEKAQIDKTPFVFGELDNIEMQLHHVTPKEFDHGGTRKWAASLSDSEFVLFMTQDAIPADRKLIENLIRALNEDAMTGAAYARQLPAADCHYLEKYTRSFNYGETSLLKTKEDLQTTGIKTFFCSNVCAMYRKSIYEQVGGFPDHTIFNEDMITAGHMILEGFKIAYAADAKVIHSHNYSGIQQFHRNFDLAVSQADFPEVFEQVRSESEGIRLVKQTSLHLVQNARIWMIPLLIYQCGCKYLGYKLGKSYRKLPKWLILTCTSNKNYWKD